MHASGLAFSMLALASLPQAEAPAALDELLREGFRLEAKNRYEEARGRFREALARAQAEGRREAEAEAYRGLGLLLYRENHYAAARGELEQALALFQTVSDPIGIGRTYNHFGSVALVLGEHAAARIAYEKALAVLEKANAPADTANVLYNLVPLPDVSAVERTRLLERAWALAHPLGDRRLEGLILHRWGDHLFLRGDFGAALEKLEAAAARLEAAGDRAALARLFTSVGRTQRAHGQYERAVEFYEKGLALQRALGDVLGEAQSHDAIASAYIWMGRPREALPHAERAVELARKAGAAAVGSYLSKLGGVLVDLGQFARAVVILEEARTSPAAWSETYLHLSMSYAALGRLHEAFEAAEKCVESARTRGNADALLGALGQRATVAERLGRVEAALADAREALSSVEQLRARLAPDDFMKQGFTERVQDLHAFGIGLLVRLGRHAEALEVAERARARAFLDLLATRELTAKPADRPQMAEVRSLESDMRASGLDPSAPGVAALTLRGGDARAASLAQRWQGLDPELKSLVSVAPTSFAEMTATAARLGSTLLCFWVGREASFAWVVTAKGEVRTHRMEIAAEALSKLVEQSRSGLATSDAAAPRTRGTGLLALDPAADEAYRRLYDVLIRPAREALPRGGRLTIVPHGPLFRLSFGALKDARGRYLLEDFELHYAPSTAVLQFTERKKARAAGRPRRYLLVADPRIPPERAQAEGLPPLPGSRAEVGAIARRLPPRDFMKLVGDQAGEAAVRAALADDTVVHFATHAIVSDQRPLDSFLALAGEGEAGAQDGRLTAAEIYGLDLRAELVVLSACRTGSGKVTGDGIIGLTRAFFYAGTPSVIASLWDLADESGHRVLPRFYASWRGGRDKAAALRKAQLDFLRALRAGRVTVPTPLGELALPEHPALWASFALQGEP